MRAALLLTALACGACARAAPPPKVADAAVLAKAAECGITTDQIKLSKAERVHWSIGPGRNGQVPSYKAFECFGSWAVKNGVRVGFISEPPPQASN